MKPANTAAKKGTEIESSRHAKHTNHDPSAVGNPMRELRRELLLDEEPKELPPIQWPHRNEVEDAPEKVDPR